MSDSQLFHVCMSSDSLSLPRPWNQKSPDLEDERFFRFQDTYPDILDVALRRIWPSRRVVISNFAVRAGTLEGSVLRAADFLSWMEPHVSILHHGIVDCWRRGDPPKPIVSPDNFAVAIRALLHQHQKSGCRALFVVFGIMPTNARMRAKDPEQAGIISKYNEILRSALADAERCRFIDVEQILAGDHEDFVHADGHHLSRRGHRLYAQLLLDVVLQEFGTDLDRLHGKAIATLIEAEASGEPDAIGVTAQRFLNDGNPELAAVLLRASSHARATPPVPVALGQKILSPLRDAFARSLGMDIALDFVEADPTNPRAVGLLSTTAFNGGFWPGVVAIAAKLEQLGGLDTVGKRRLALALERCGNDAAALAIAHELFGSDEDDAQVGRQIERIRNRGIRPMVRAEDHAAQARQLVRRGENEKALQSAQRALNVAPSSLECWCAFRDSVAAVGDYEDRHRIARLMQILPLS
jgi:hypothetical protein